MAKMRAKMVLANIQQFGDGTKITQEVLTFNAVARSGRYDNDGSDEDNTYAKFTPNASCSVTVQNPALLGQFVPGEKYYVDFSNVPEAVAPPQVQNMTDAGKR